MRARVSQATLRRLERLLQPTTAIRGGLLVVPHMLDIDTWQAQAHAWHKRMLLLNESDRERRPIASPGPEPARPPTSYSLTR